MLKVLSEYPEAKMTIEEQASSLGETFQELVKRLDEGIFLCHTPSLISLYLSEFRS